MLKRLGRPRERQEFDQEDPLAKYDVRLSYRQARLARRMGNTNLSEGVRAAIEHAAADTTFMEKIQKNPDKKDKV
jgi:hypothetical protein